MPHQNLQRFEQGRQNMPVLHSGLRYLDADLYRACKAPPWPVCVQVWLCCTAVLTCTCSHLPLWQHLLAHNEYTNTQSSSRQDRGIAQVLNQRTHHTSMIGRCLGGAGSLTYCCRHNHAVTLVHIFYSSLESCKLLHHVPFILSEAIWR
jgi:hypothetical protein